MVRASCYICATKFPTHRKRLPIPEPGPDAVVVDVLGTVLVLAFIVEVRCGMVIIFKVAIVVVRLIRWR